jgi:hypothetical protein
LVLGAYAQDFHARRQIELVKTSLHLPLETGRPEVIPLADGKYFAALLVDLDEDRATATCAALRRNGAYCVTLSPSELNAASASWRE